MSVELLRSIAIAPVVAFSFNSAFAGCEGIAEYNSKYADYEGSYGQHLRGKGGYDFLYGFYQMVEFENKIYAAFSGAFSQKGPIEGIAPGGLIVLDAETLRWEKSVPLPFHAFSLELNAKERKIIASHAKVNALSIFDIDNMVTSCIKPYVPSDGDQEYQMRYISSDAEGDFYVSYHSGYGDEHTSILVKYDSNGFYNSSFAAKNIERGMVLPVLYDDGKLLTGRTGIKVVDAQTGQITHGSTENQILSIYNYAKGPGGTILASNYHNDAVPNLILFDPATNSQSSLYTGSTSVELAYLEEGGHAFITNYGPKTLTVAELPGDVRGFANNRFVNILLEGNASSLHARRTKKGSEIFVTPKFWGDDNADKHGLINKIVIDSSVQGIDGIDSEGACTITTFDLTSKQVSAPQPCTLLSPHETYQAEMPLIKKHLAWQEEIRERMLKSIPESRAALLRAQRASADEAEIIKLEKALLEDEKRLGYMEEGIPRTRIGIEVLTRLAGD